jgi:hypothetical protein
MLLRHPLNINSRHTNTWDFDVQLFIGDQAACPLGEDRVLPLDPHLFIEFRKDGARMPRRQSSVFTGSRVARQIDVQMVVCR